jgi:hypothetical protein
MVAGGFGISSIDEIGARMLGPGGVVRVDAKTGDGPPGAAH